MRKVITIVILCISFAGISVYSQSTGNSIINANFSRLSVQQLLDTANYYYDRSISDTAMICYNLLVKIPVRNHDTEHHKQIIEACNRLAALYYNMNDYRSAYSLLIKALSLSEKQNYREYQSKIYNNLGNIYSSFNKKDIAEQYYLKALNLSNDTINTIILLNNLGYLKMESGKPDSILNLLNRSLNLSRQRNNIHSATIKHSIAMFYRQEKQYDSAFHYFRQSLNESLQNDDMKARKLLDLTKLFFETGRIDSALLYTEMLNAVTAENNFPAIQAECHLILSKIEESKGFGTNAFEHFKRYVELKDSIFNAEKFGEINQLQRLYEISKTNEEIELLSIKQQIDERTIRYRTIIMFISITLLLIVSGALVYVFLRERKLYSAYAMLVEKNKEIIKLEHEKRTEKYARNILADDAQKELLQNILTVMEDTSVFCDPEFTIEKLSVLLHSNRSYISPVINDVLNKNFRSFLNEYRIKEAQRLFSEPDNIRYTIESVAFQVGFKSPSNFRTVFKDHTGVSPSFYLKSMRG